MKMKVYPFHEDKKVDGHLIQTVMFLIYIMYKDII